MLCLFLPSCAVVRSAGLNGAQGEMSMLLVLFKMGGPEPAFVGSLSLVHVGAESAILPTQDRIESCILELSALNLYRALAPRRAAAHPTSDSPRPV